MNRQPRLIRSITEFRRYYHELRPGDAVLGTLPLRPGEEFKLLDLADRGVALFPPALAQLLARSKVAQAEVLREFMVPGTFVAYGLADLADHLAEVHELYPGRGGQQTGPGPSGSGRGPLAFPGGPVQPGRAPAPVLSPGGAAVGRRRPGIFGWSWWPIIREAYERVNPHSFRKNLFQGGSSRPEALTPAQTPVLPPGHGPGKISLCHPGPPGQPGRCNLSF